MSKPSPLISFSLIIAETFGFPTVKVPVLSKTITFTPLIDSNEFPPFKSIPFSAPFPVPTITAVGIAKPKAHGQEITTTDVNTSKETSNPRPAIKYQ